MSLLTGLKGGLSLLQAGKGAGVFGGSGLGSTLSELIRSVGPGIIERKTGPNIARDLSNQAGCTILQKDAAAARAAMASGINPCTGFSEMLNRPDPVIPGFGPGFGPVMGGTGMSALPVVGRGIISGGAGLVRTATGRISKILLPSGQTFTRKNAAALIRRVGFETAAVALGITALEAAELLLQDSKTRRRRKGITGAQLATAKRVNCTVKRMASDLGVSRSPVRRRKTTCR